MYYEPPGCVSPYPAFPVAGWAIEWAQAPAGNLLLSRTASAASPDEATDHSQLQVHGPVGGQQGTDQFKRVHCQARARGPPGCLSHEPTEPLIWCISCHCLSALTEGLSVRGSAVRTFRGANPPAESILTRCTNGDWSIFSSSPPRLFANSSSPC